MVLRHALIFAAAIGLIACPGSLDPMEFGEGGTMCPDVPTLFLMRCSTAGCHTTMTPASNLDLQSPNPGPRVVGAMAQSCGGGLVGDMKNPDNSIMLKKLRGNDCGTRMPLGQMPLSSMEVDCIKTWIANGGK